MSRIAKASLFYGIVLKEDFVKDLINKFGTGKCTRRVCTEPAHSDDLYNQLETIARLNELKVIYCTYGEKTHDEYGIAVYEHSSYEYDKLKKFNIPNETSLIEKWNKLAKKLALGDKTPGWYLFVDND